MPALLNVDRPFLLPPYRWDRPLFRIKDHRLGLATVVCLPAQRPAVNVDRRRCTWMYETANETAAQLSLGWPAEGKHADDGL